MPIEINDRMLVAVLALPAAMRYSHFIKLAADQERVWGLFDKDWLRVRLADDTEALALWPAYRYALSYASETNSRALPREIDLKILLESLIPSLQRSGSPIAVFPTTLDTGLVPASGQLENDLRNELANYD